MELQLHLHRWERREPDWSVAAVAGFAAGAVLMVLELIWASIMGTMGPWRISQLVAAFLLGPDSLRSSTEGFSVLVVGVALVTHYALGVAFGMVLGLLSAGFHYDTGPGALAVVGLAFGAVLYLFSFHVATQVFVWFTELRGWATAIEHVLFGMVAAVLYARLERGERARPLSSR